MSEIADLIDVIDHPGAEPDPERPVRPASTVILLRDETSGGAELEVFMIQRGEGGAFGGMWAFPGGVIEADDIPAGTGRDPLPAARRAAARETHEEVGLVVDPESFVFWSHWVPPMRGPELKRFSTWFFVAPAGEGHADEHVGLETEEVDDHRWVAPSVALDLHARGEVLLVPPTFVTLTQLTRYGDVASALRAADPTYFATELTVVDGVRICLWAGDVGFGGGDPTAEGPRHRLRMDDDGGDGWTYLRSG